MKKTLIALFALAGVALADETKTLTYTVDLSANAYDGYKSKPSDSTGWVNLDWGKFTAENVGTDLSLLKITSAGNYGFNHAGNTENTSYGFGVG